MSRKRGPDAARFEAGERILEISEEMQDLLQEAMDLVRSEGTNLDWERARSYWYGHIQIALGGDHGYLGRSMCSMTDTAEELMAEDEEPEEEEDDE